MNAADPRLEELRDRLGAVEDRIRAACAAAGRPRADLTLVVVTKFFPAEDVVRLHALGVRDIGENKVQEAVGKLAELPAPVRQELRVHAIGQVQTNKARQVVGYADLVHAVDRARLVRALDRAAGQQERSLDVLLQVDLDEAAAAGGEKGGRGGALPQDLPALADEVGAAEHLRLRGVMAVAPLGADPGQAFARLAEVSQRLRSDHPGARVVSAGMSGDLEQAVAAGATHLRVGSAILGHRPTPR